MAKKHTLEDFIRLSKEVHGNKYDYSKVEYVNNYSYVIIICPNHGEYNRIAKKHYMNEKSGCPECGTRALKVRETWKQSRKTHEQFLIDAKKVHGDRYDYSLCEYTTSKTKMPIICKVHGIFYQHSEAHVNSGHGCRKCYNDRRKEMKGCGGFSNTFFETYPEMKNDNALLYVTQMQHKNDNFLKIGITRKNSVKERFYSKSKHGTIFTPLIEFPTTLYDAFIKEQYLLKKLDSNKFFPNRKFEGYTECLKINEETLSYLENYFGVDFRDRINTNVNNI